MAIPAGERLGPYEILAPLGAGGMGEVYRARDTRLDRTIAIKVLPEHIAHREDLRNRFEREARTVASLKHPNICVLYDIGNQGGIGYIVMELVEGETLARRIEKGPIPLHQAIEYATQIADALDRAHRAGVTHRDVKPQNIILTRDGAKVLDFGLAKTSEPRPTEATLTAMLTTEGTVVGTPQYMAPEQFEGKEADARSDIWAFGAVLYEMVTGHKAFHGKSYASLVGAILSADPPSMAVKPFTPDWLERLVRRCLTKDPEERYFSMHDVALELRTPIADSAAGPPSSKAARWPWVVTGAVTLIAVVLAWRAANPPELPLKSMIRLDAALGSDAITSGFKSFAISPDGERLVFTVRAADGKSRLATRSLSDDKVTVLEGTENPRHPFFSPDGAWIAYQAEGKLRKVATRGGAPVVISDAPMYFGGTWTDDTTLVVALSSGAAPLSRVTAAGGAPKPIGNISGASTQKRFPMALPGGEYVLVAETNFGIRSSYITAVSTRTGESRRLVEDANSPRYLANPSAEKSGSGGYLLYQRDTSLFAVGFNPTTLEIVGNAVLAVDDVFPSQFESGSHWDLSRNGVLCYRRGRPADQTWPVLWLDPNGQTRPLVAERQAYQSMRFSPDGNRLALPVSRDSGRDMFVYDLARETTSRVTSAGKEKSPVDWPVWTSDGKHIISAYPGPSGFGIAYYRADGGGDPQILLDSGVRVFPSSISPDGAHVAYTRNDPVSSYDILILPLDNSDPGHPKAGKPEVFLQTQASEAHPAFSPDGRWMAYVSTETGVYEVYVRPFLSKNQRRASTTLRQPAWKFSDCSPLTWAAPAG